MTTGVVRDDNIGRGVMLQWYQTMSRAPQRLPRGMMERLNDPGAGMMERPNDGAAQRVRLRGPMGWLALETIAAAAGWRRAAAPRHCWPATHATHVCAHVCARRKFFQKKKRHPHERRQVGGMTIWA